MDEQYILKGLIYNFTYNTPKMVPKAFKDIFFLVKIAHFFLGASFQIQSLFCNY